MTAGARHAFGAEFTGAAGFLNSPTYGLPPTFLVEELDPCLADWRAGGLDVPSFDGWVRRGREAYAQMVGMPG